MSALQSKPISRPLPGRGINHLSPGSRDLLLFCPLMEAGGQGFQDIVNRKGFSFENADINIWAPSPDGGAVEFNGTNQYASLDASSTPDVDGDFTLYMKVLVRSAVAWDSYFARSSSTSWNDGYGFYWENGSFRFFVGSYLDRASISLNYNEWYYWFGVLDGTAIKFHVVDLSEEFTSGSEDTYGSASLNAGNLTIGGSLGGYSDRSDCCVEELGIFNRAFGKKDILEFLRDRSSLFSRTRLLYVSAVTAETGLLTVGASAGMTSSGIAAGAGALTAAAQAGETSSGIAAGAGALTAAAQAGETSLGIAAGAGALTAAAQAGETSLGIAAGAGALTAAAQAGTSMAALSAAAASLDAGAVASETIAALAAAAAAVIAGAQADDTWSSGGETATLSVGAQSGITFAAAAAAYGALTGATSAESSISATAAALASLTIHAEADASITPVSSAEGNIVLRGAILLQSALRGEIDINPLLRGLPSTRPH